MIRKHTLIGAAGAAALTVGAFAAPAMAAPQVVTYSCFNGALSIPITMDAGTLPTSMVAGQKVVQTISGANVALSGDVVNVALSQGWDAVSASTASSTGTPYSLKVPKTALPAPSTPLDLPATGAFTIRPTKAGTYTVKAGNMTATIQGWTGATKSNAIPLDCVAPTDGSNVFGTIAVSKDASTTTVGAAYSATKKLTAATAKVQGKNFHLTGTGTVTFKLKKGTTTLMTIKGAKLNSKGVAKAVFKKALRHGKYSVVAIYGGSAGLKASTGAHTFSVS